MNEKCEQYSHLIPDYCLGLLDKDTHAEIEALLPTCPELAELVTNYQDLAEPLLYSVPPANAPAHLLENIMLETRPTAKTRRLKINISPTMWRNLAAGLTILILFVSSNFYWYQRTHDLQQELSGLSDELRLSQQQDTTLAGYVENDGDLMTNNLNMDAAQQQIPIGISMNNSLTTNNLTQINNYSPMNTANLLNTQVNDQYASLVWSQGSTMDTWLGVFSAQNFAMNSTDSIYQLWLNRRNEAPLSVGVFGVNDLGNGLLVFEVEEPIESFDSISVTNEPVTGSFIPTTDPIITADLHNWVNLDSGFE